MSFGKKLDSLLMVIALSSYTEHISRNIFFSTPTSSLGTESKYTIDVDPLHKTTDRCVESLSSNQDETPCHHIAIEQEDYPFPSLLKLPRRNQDTCLSTDKSGSYKKAEKELSNGLTKILSTLKRPIKNSSDSSEMASFENVGCHLNTTIKVLEQRLFLLHNIWSKKTLREEQPSTSTGHNEDGVLPKNDKTCVPLKSRGKDFVSSGSRETMRRKTKSLGVYKRVTKNFNGGDPNHVSILDSLQIPQTSREKLLQQDKGRTSLEKKNIPPKKYATQQRHSVDGIATVRNSCGMKSYCRPTLASTYRAAEQLKQFANFNSNGEKMKKRLT